MGDDGGGAGEDYKKGVEEEGDISDALPPDASGVCVGTPVRVPMASARGLSTPNNWAGGGGGAGYGGGGAAQALFTTPLTQRDDGDEDMCAVCRELLNTEELQHTMHCKHRYHTECLRKMRGHNLASCPLCRAPITPGFTPAHQHPAEASLSPLRMPQGLSMSQAIAFRAATARRAVQQRIVRDSGRRLQFLPEEEEGMKDLHEPPN